jgi:hypothetical protein
MIGPLGQTIIYVCLLALVAGILWWTHSLNRRRLLRLTELLDERGGEVTGFPVLMLKGHYQGRPVSFRIRLPSGKMLPRALYVSLHGVAPLSFWIEKEGMADFLAAKLGLAHDIEVGDEDLDRDFQFSSPEPERFASWFSDSAVRSTVETLMRKHGVDMLAQGPEICAELIRFRSREAKLENIRAVLEGLSALSQTLDRA